MHHSIIVGTAALQRALVGRTRVDALVALDLVGDTRFLEQAKNPLRARIIEVMNDNHSWILTG